MSQKVIITCAVTGGNNAVLEKHPDIPKTPSQIANAALEAAKTGAAVAHIHVRDPDTGLASNQIELYERVVNTIRDAATDVIINLTCGMDGMLAIDSVDPLTIGEATTLKDPWRRCGHAVKLQPELSTLDCATLMFAGGEHIFVSRMSDLREMAKLMREAGVMPELECFDLGHIEIAKRLISEGAVDGPGLFQFCLGTGIGAPANPIVVQAMRELLPPGAMWGGFGCGADEMPMVAQIASMGGNVRVGLEDNIYLRRGVLATNSQLVENAVDVIERMGASVASPAEARAILGLVKRG